MITCHNLDDIPVAGRLGNNLFLIAATIAVGMEYKIPWYLPEWRYSRYFHLLGFGGYDWKYQFRVYKERSCYYEHITIDSNVHTLLEGYFQSYKYHSVNPEMIREYLNPDIDVPVSGNVAIHVRRGDYLNLSQFYPTLGMDYYQKAMDLFPGRAFTIFSDDISWCAKNFNADNCVFATSNKDIEDLKYMSLHKDMIIANSSFSWWAAYLNPHKRKMIVAPKIWDYREDRDDRVPLDWVRV